MEIKKSRKADLERKRPLWFFLALAINVSVFVAMLEYVPAEGEASAEDFVKSVSSIVETREMMAAETAVAVMHEEKKAEDDECSGELEVVDDAGAAETVLLESAAGREEAPEPVVSEPDDGPLKRDDVVTDLSMLEEIPSYPGGMSKFVKWLTANLVYPEKDRMQKTQGTVMASFIINADGSISSLNVRKSLSEGCDAEVMRVLAMMDNWKPGKRNGKPCRTMFCIPVEFKL